MKIKIVLNGNRIIMEFPSQEEATFFYNFLKTFKQIEGYESSNQDPTQLRISINDLEKYKEFLKHKPRRPILDPETIRDYINSLKKFIECSKGIINTDTLLHCIKNKHYASALRNYLHMKYYYKEISKEVYQELLERIPKFNKELRLARDHIPVSNVLISLDKAKGTKYHVLYYTLFYTGGARLEQLIESIQNKPIAINNEIVKIPVKYKGTKSSIYLYIPRKIYRKLKQLKIQAKPKTIIKIFRELELLPITLIRSFCWQTSKQILGETLALVLQGRIGELRKQVTAISYDDLLFQLDMMYYKWKEFVDDLIKNSTIDNHLAKKRAKQLISKYNLLMPV